MEDTLHLQNLLNSEMAVWGEDYIYDLIDRGYEPTVVSDGTSVKLVWRLTQPETCATMGTVGFYSRLSRSADRAGDGD